MKKSWKFKFGTLMKSHIKSTLRVFFSTIVIIFVSVVAIYMCQLFIPMVYGMFGESLESVC